MNNCSIQRILLLIKKQWVENRRLYLMSILAVLGILSIVFTFWIKVGGSNYQEGTAYAFGFIGMYIFGGIFAGTSFNMLNEKDKGIYWISFPASHFEKLVAVLFFNVIVFTVAYAACFFLLKSVADAYIQGIINSSVDYRYDPVNWGRARGFGQAAPIFLFAFFIVQAAFVLGSATFKKFSFIITTVIISAVLFIMVSYMLRLHKGLLPDGYNFNFSTVIKDLANSTYEEYQMNGLLKSFLEIFLKYLFAPFLWFVTWYKLKEKEI